MTTTTNTKERLLKPSTLVQLLIVVVLIPFLPLLISRRWDWWEAWIFAVVFIGGFVVSRVLAVRRHPDLLAERVRFMKHENVEPWDKILAPLVGFGGGLISLVAGLDALYNWPPEYSLPVKLLALALILAGYALGTYALMANRFFSGSVRLQHERDHQVVTGGPYRWLRHPGYTAAILSYLGMPLLLDAAWAFVPAILMVIVLIVRTVLEDRFLHENLPDYTAYAGRVRYRLAPGIW